MLTSGVVLTLLQSSKNTTPSIRENLAKDFRDLTTISTSKKNLQTLVAFVTLRQILAVSVRWRLLLLALIDEKRVEKDGTRPWILHGDKSTTNYWLDLTPTGGLCNVDSTSRIFQNYILQLI